MPPIIVNEGNVLYSDIEYTREVRRRRVSGKKKDISNLSILTFVQYLQEKQDLGDEPGLQSTRRLMKRISETQD